jgi:transcriptional regulator with XRE-family HTH domain
MSPGTLIQQARTNAGLSQQALAERAGTSQATLSAYERGRKDPSASTLARLLAAAGSKLTTKPKTAVIVPSTELLEERGRVLGEVLELADGLPVRHRATLRYPILKASVRHG